MNDDQKQVAISPPGTKEEVGLFDLLIRDLDIDRQVMKALHENMTALRRYVPAIGNVQVRDAFSQHLYDGVKALAAMEQQKRLQRKTLDKMRDQWLQLPENQKQAKAAPATPQPAAAEPQAAPEKPEFEETPASAASAEAEKSAPSTPSTSSAAAAQAPAPSQDLE